MFVNFKFSTLKIQVIAYLKPKGNSVVQLSISDYHSVKPSLTKHVLLV